MYSDLSEGISSSVTSLGVKGIVYEDTNGLMNSTVDGIGSNAGGTLFAMLVDGAGHLVDSFAVKEDGTFILGGATANTSYTVVLSTSSGSLGGAAPVPDLPTGWMNTGEFLGTGVGSDGTVNGRLAVSIVNNGLVNARFGISQTVSVGNLVWNDANNNGLKDSIESGISGVTAQLWNPGSDNAIGGTGSAADTLVATTTTTGSGLYGFTNQVQGKYFICVIPPTLYSFASSTVVTTDNGVDSDNNGAQPGGRATQVYSPVFDLAVGKEPGNLVSGGIDIDNTIDFGLLTALDFGDYSLFGSASSALVTNLFMGTLIDAEYAATTDVTATGDNLTGLNDEDGVTIPVTGVVLGGAGSMTVRVTNTSGSSAFMNVWIDFNNNGVLSDAGEQVAVNTLIANATSNATRTVNFTTPVTAFIGNVGVRVRLTSTNSPGSVGSSGKGEVEDHLIEIVSPIDYGDFASFASAGSTMVNTLFMGTLVDTEPSSTTNAAATADDLNGSDDEDGAIVPATMTQGAPGTISVNVTNTSGGNARLSAWIDFNRNGVLTDAGEQVANDLVINKSTIGANEVIHFTVPVHASIGTAGLRVRLTDQNNAASVGLVGNGEVEDHTTSIGLPTTDFGDWNGAADASSLFSANLRIGTLTDNEFVSTLNATATGDDITGSDDEDGVMLAASYIPAVAGTATVVVTNSSGAAAYLNAWIDYNNNGSFADAGEQIATDTPVATGTMGASQTLNFTPPLTAIPGQRGARFRLTSVTNPTPVGAAGSGEVEDAMVTINCPDITVNPTTLAAPVVGFAYTQNVTATGTPLVWSATNLPAWLSLNSATGALTGTATTTTPVTFTLTATDANGCAGSRVQTLTPACPVITLGGVPPPNSYLSTSYTHTLTASGGTAPYSFSLISGTLPPGITLASNGTVSGMPTSLGSYAVTLQVTDAYNCQSATTSVTFVAKRMAIGNQVWIDMNDDGLRNSTESGVPNLPLQLWSPGINGNAENGRGDDVMLATTLTDSNGLYLFTNLAPGVYYVCIPTPPTYYPKVSTSQVALDNRVNNDNNGLQTVSGDPVVTPLITLSPGTEPSSDADGDDTDADSTVDISFANPSPCLVTNLIDNPSFEFQGLPNTTGTPVSMLGYNGAGTALGTHINAYQWLGGTNGTSGLGEPVQRAQILAGNNGSRVSWTESVKSRHGKRMLLMQGTNSCISLRPAGGGAWSSVLQAGKEYELSVWAANASSGAASILWDLGANAHVFQIITGSTPGMYQYYTVPQGELSATAPGVDQCCGFTGGTISYAAFGAADYNGWIEAIANNSQPVWRQFTYRFRIANAATQTQIDSASIVLSGGSSTHPVVTDLVYLCQVGTSATLTLGNQVWNDANKNGVRDTGAFSELGAGGVTVELFRSTNDSAGDADDLLVGSTTTSPVGSYNFTGLAEGKYVVRVTPPSGIPAAGGNVVTADNGINNDNNGSQPGGPGTYLYSPVIRLAVGTEPVNDGDANPDTELSVDFGLFTGIQVGNQLFIDVNNDGVYTSGSESGVGAGVAVELLDGTVDTVIASTTTNSSGVYGFSVYQPGAYRVRIPTPPVAYPLASGVADLSDNGEDNDSNGSQPGGLGTTVISPTIMLTAAREPGSSGSSNTENTLDFGFRGCPTITISPGTVGLATQYVAYNPLSLSSSGGSGGYSYQISSGGLPSGMSLSSGGVISGTPGAVAAPGSYNFTVRSMDSQGCTGTQSYTLMLMNALVTVNPATLPAATQYVAYSQGLVGSGGTAPYAWTFGPSAMSGAAVWWPGESGAAELLSSNHGGLLNGVGFTSGMVGEAFDFDGTNDSMQVADQSVMRPNQITIEAWVRPHDATPSGDKIIIAKTSTPGSPTDGYGLTQPSGSSTVRFWVNRPSTVALYSDFVDAPLSVNAWNHVVATYDNAALRIYVNGVQAAAQLFDIAIHQSTQPLLLGGSSTAGTNWNGALDEVVIYNRALSSAEVSARRNITISGNNGLPTGLSIDSASGLLSGTATSVPGSYPFTARASDSYGGVGLRAYTLTVSCAVLDITPKTLADATQYAAYTATTLNATGGAAPYQWDITSGALPTGMSLSNVGVLSGTPGSAPGSYFFTVRARDANNCVSTQALSVRVVCPAITLSPVSLADARQFLAYSAVLMDGTGGSAPYTFSIDSAALPSGMSLSTSGVLSGTPTSAPGTYNVTISASDANGCTGSRIYGIVINCPTISINAPPLPSGTKGVEYTVQQLTASAGTAPYTWSLVGGTLPAGLSLSNAGQISGTPSGAPATYSFTVRATDGVNCSATRALQIVIACPTLSMGPVPLPAAVQYASYSQTLAVGGGTAPYTWSLASGVLPTGMTLSSGGVLSGAPTSLGSSTFSVRATDAEGCSTTQSYTMAVDYPPISILPPTLPDATRLVPYFQQITASGGTAPYSYSRLTGNLPAGITISSTGVISGTTTAAPGNYSFTVQALDAKGAPGTQPYTITVRCSDFVITPSALASGTVGSVYSAPLNAVGGSAPYLWSVASGSLPPGLSLSSSGLISGTPTQAMTASFTVEARDAFDCAATRLYTLVVNCPSLSITPATLSSAYYGSAYSQQLAASGSTGPYTWSVIAGTPPAGITLSSSGLLSGSSSVYGTASFTVRAMDAYNCSTTQSYSLLVKGLSLGDVVYEDTNFNGLRDNGEPGLKDVTVELWDTGADNAIGGSGPSSDLRLRSTVTGALGQYHFDNLQPGSFFLRLLMPSELNIPGGNPVNLDNGIDNDNNSASQPGGPGTPVFSAVIALTQSGEPTVDDGDPDTDHTLDFGLFRGMSVGNLVWQDTNDNGLRDPGEPGLGGIALELWITGADNRIGGTDDVRLRTTSSASDGSYLFSALPPLKVYVRIPAPPAAQPLSSSITVTADNGVDQDDNGHQINGGATYSQVITLSPGNEPGVGGGTYDETTIDFGFYNVTPSIYVSATQADSIQTFDASTGLYTGSLVGAFGSSQSQGNAEWGDVPYALEFGPDGNWYVAHYGASNLRKISPAGVDLGTVLDNSTAGVSLIDQFTLGPDGDFYVVDANGGRVVRFQGPGGTTPGAPIGTAPFTFITQNGIEDINFGPDGNLYIVVQTGTVREVRRYNATTGALLNTIVSVTQIVQMVPGGQPIALISGIDIHDNTLYGVNRSDGEIFRVDLTTPAAPGLPQLLATLSTAGMGDVDTRDIEFNPANGRLYISGYQWGKPVNAGSYISGSLISVDITGAPNGTVSIHEVPIPRPPGPNNEIWAGPRDLAIGRPFAPLPESVSIGSIVWNDLDADGIQDASEQGIAGVRVELWRDANGSTADGAEFLVGWTFTDTNGHYYFSGQAPGVYQVRIPVSNFGEGLPLAGSGYSSPLTSILDDQIDGDDSGRQPGGPKTLVFSPLITLTPGAEPLGNGTSAAEHARGGELDNYTVDANGDMTIDFGFVEPGIMGIGNLVFVDANGNNRFDVGEGRDEATVELYRWGDIPGVTQPVATTVTTNGGLFLFSNLWQGQYFIHLPATQFESSGNLRGLFSLPGYSTGDDDTGEDSIDSDEPWVTGISSSVINLVREEAPTDDGIETGHDSATDLDDFNINLTADMGLFRPVALGNLVFADNNSNGRFDSGEAITGVRVELYTDTQFPGVDHPLSFTTTDSQGRYGFSFLRPGNYIVHVPASEFVSGKPLFQRISILEGLVGDDDVGEDGVNNGDPATNGVSTLVISLFPGNAPTDDSGETGFKHPSDNQIDAAVDLTIDFGFQTPVGVGNLVYIDSNVNGFADLGEGVDGVTVELYRADQTPGFGLPIFSRVTSSGGHYFFDSLPAGDYRLHIPPSEFEPGRPLYMLESSPGASSVTAALDDNVDDNENGLDAPTPFLNGISTAVFTLAVDEEPTATSGEAGLGAFEDDERDDNNFNLTLDFGFSPSNPNSVGVGNLVFVDLNGNGIYDENEGIDGVKVQLFGSGADPLTAMPLASTITSGGGHYIFGNLAEGDYFVFIPPSEFAPGKSLSGWRSIPGDGSDNGIDDNLDENGIDSAVPTTMGIASAPFNLTPDAEPTNSLGEFGSNSFSDDVNDDNTDLTIDFGFFRSVSVGNLVFIDANYNGRSDTGEGVGGVTVELYTENSFIPFDAPVATTVSAEDGTYLFSDLVPGRYFLRVPAWQFDFGMPLYFHASSLGVQSGDDHLGEDGIDNGNPSFNGINTAVFELTPTNAPVGSQEGGHLGSSDDIDDSATNLTLDLGFVPQVTIGNLIFSDANNDGIFDPNIEIGLDGVTVELCSNLPDATVPVATTSTYDGGLYSFNVAPGSYFVRVSATNFAQGAALEGSLPSLPSAARLPTTTAGDDDAGQDGYTTGSVLTDGVRTPLFTLLPGSAPTSEDTETGYLSETDDYADTDVDLTVDLGFSPKAIMVGNLVFRDLNSNGIYDVGIDLPMPNVTVRLFQQAQAVTDTPVSEAVTSANGTYMLYATSPTAYYVHIPASMFAAGAPLSGLTSIPGLGNHSLSTNANTAKDDRHDENGTDPSAPQLTGVSSGIINLAYGAMPVNSSPTAATGENGHEAFMDDAADSSGIMTIDFGFAAPLGAPLDQRMTPDLSPAPAEESSETTTFTSWQARNHLAGLNHPADDPDADGHTNLLEYALGTSPASGAQISRFRLATHDATGVIDALITRPLGEHRDLRYILESSADLQTWEALSITPTTIIGADQTETLRFADLEAATTQVQGFVRLKIQLDADLNGTAEATAVTPVQGWSRRTFNVGRETLSMPLLKPAVFIGLVSSVNGTQLTLPVTIALSPETAHYLEVLDGPLAGQTFDLGSDLKLASGAAVAGARVAIRPHWTLNSLLPASAFHSGSTPEESDRALTFDSASNGFQTHPFADESTTRRVVPPQEGLFVQIRSTAVTLAFLGEVRTSPLALPHSSGTRFIGTGLALPLTPGSQPHSVGSRLRLWSGDADPATAAYHNYLLNDLSHWIDESTGADITTQPALDAFRAHFLVK